MGTELNSQGNSTSSIVISTDGFMPSEQAAGRPVYSSDIYALGLTAIYLLTGKIPQELPSYPQTGEIIWHHYALNLSPTFAAILDKAIQSHPHQAVMKLEFGQKLVSLIKIFLALFTFSQAGYNSTMPAWENIFILISPNCRGGFHRDPATKSIISLNPPHPKREIKSTLINLLTLC